MLARRYRWLFQRFTLECFVLSDVAIVGPLCTGPFPGPAGGRLRSGRRQIHAGSLPIAAGSLPIAAGSCRQAAGSLPLK